MASNGLAERHEHHLVRLRVARDLHRGRAATLHGPLKARLPLIEQSQSLGGLEARLVGVVVSAAREGVDRRNVRPRRPWQKPGGHREVLVVVPGDALAMRVGPLERQAFRHHSVSG